MQPPGVLFIRTRCFGPSLIPVAVIALARRHHFRKGRASGFQVTDPATGKELSIRTPDGLPSANDVMTAVESVRDWGLGLHGDEQAVFKLAWPYRLNGPNPSPELQKYIFKAMQVTFHPKALENHSVIQAEAHRIHMRQLVSSISS